MAGGKLRLRAFGEELAAPPGSARFSAVWCVCRQLSNRDMQLNSQLECMNELLYSLRIL